MKGYDKGTVCFDTLTVLGREFVTNPNPLSTCYWDYVFTANCMLDGTKPKKKGGIEHYMYGWAGHLNIGVDGKRVHLHNMDDDVGLINQEAKLQLLHDTLKEFIKNYKEWAKEENRMPLSIKHWLNPPDSRFTGMVSYSLAADGTGTVSIGDCHNTIVIWVYIPYKSVSAKDGYSQKIIKQIEELAKGASRAVAAIKQLRKFFEREVFDSPEK